MPLVAQALAGVHLDRLDLEVRSLGEDRVAAPWAVDMLSHPAIVPDPQKDSYMHLPRALASQTGRGTLPAIPGTSPRPRSSRAPASSCQVLILVLPE